VGNGSRAKKSQEEQNKSNNNLKTVAIYATMPVRNDDGVFSQKT